MKKDKIRKLIPVSEQLTPMLREEHEDGRYNYFDAIGFGWTVFYALLDDEFGSYTEMYVIDGRECIGELEEPTNVRLVPTMKCSKCGRRMFAGTFPDAPEHVVYRCICGEKIDEDAIKKVITQYDPKDSGGVNSFEKQEPLRIDLRAYARYIQENNIQPEQVTEEMVERFRLSEGAES